MTAYSLKGKGLKITTIEDAQPFADEISAFKNLETLDLTGNSLGPEAAKVIFAAVEQHQTIKVNLGFLQKVCLFKRYFYISIER